MSNAIRLPILGLLLATLAGCSSHPPIRIAEQVDIDRFMGDWYVIANIPTFLEKDAHNAVESYALNDDGSIATTFSFNAGSFDGERKVYRPTGYVGEDPSNAIWGMQFIWPIKADFRILHVDPDYQSTIIGRLARDYVWIMTRTPTIPEAEFTELTRIVAEAGYDVSRLQRVPQRWDNGDTR